MSTAKALHKPQRHSRWQTSIIRSLVVQSGWEIAAEDYLIHLLRSISNSETNALYGLVKKDGSATTRANNHSQRDTLHPGCT